MAKPPTSVRSIRLADDLWAALQAQADSLGVSLNRYVAMRLDGGVRRDLASAAKVLAAKVAEPAPVKAAPKPARLVNRLKGEWKAP